MHPLNDIRKGESLVKRVYEAIRNSEHWPDTMFIITFDEHGGFYDHQSPPAAVPTGDDSRYANVNYHFRFDRLGVRVPALVISAYTEAGTIIGTDPTDGSTVFDHSSVLATVEKLYGLEPLTQRDALANSLEVALNSSTPRLSPAEAPTALPKPAWDSPGATLEGESFASQPKAALSTNQKTMAALALACDLKITPQELAPALISNHQKLVEQEDASTYISTVEKKVTGRRAKRR